MSCFNDHILSPCFKASLPWYCSMCGNESMDKVSLHNCKVCNFDACNACAGCGYCIKGHLLLDSGCDSNETCSECMKQVEVRCYVCNQCEYIVCETCAVIPMINKVKIGKH